MEARVIISTGSSQFYPVAIFVFAYFQDGRQSLVVPELGFFLFVLKGPYDPRVPPIVKFSQESESVRLTKIILSKSTVKTL